VADGPDHELTIDELAVPIMAAGLVRECRVRHRALTKRAAPSLNGIWCGIAGVSIVVCRGTVVDLIIHGQVRNAPTSILYSGGILLLG